MKDFVIENGVLIEYKGEGGNVLLPEGVTEIGDFAFANCKTLTGVTIPSSITVIGENAFDECENLSSVTLPDSVKEIHQEAFIRCKSLADQDGFAIVRDVLYGYYGTSECVNIPAGITEICAFAFEGADVVSVSIPMGVTRIGAWAFSRCSKLTTIALPESLNEIGMGAFCNCESLAAVTIPYGIKKLNMHTFEGCKKMATVTVPDSAKIIDESAFYNCDGLADPDGFVIINHVLYDYFGQTLEVNIPDDVRKISRFHVREWTGRVISVSIPDSVAEIEANAFDIAGAFIIKIPNSVTKIGKDALHATFRTVYVPAGSYAEQYAKENDVPYILI